MSIENLSELLKGENCSKLFRNFYKLSKTLEREMTSILGLSPAPNRPGLFGIVIKRTETGGTHEAPVSPGFAWTAHTHLPCPDCICSPPSWDDVNISAEKAFADPNGGGVLFLVVENLGIWYTIINKNKYTKPSKTEYKTIFDETSKGSLTPAQFCERMFSHGIVCEFIPF